jgi:hypothetical protein
LNTQAWRRNIQPLYVFFFFFKIQKDPPQNVCDPSSFWKSKWALQCKSYKLNLRQRKERARRMDVDGAYIPADPDGPTSMRIHARPRGHGSASIGTSPHPHGHAFISNCIWMPRKNSSLLNLFFIKRQLFCIWESFASVILELQISSQNKW